MTNVMLPIVIMLNAAMLSVIILIVAIVIAVMLIVITLSFAILKAARLSDIILSVTAPT